MALALLAILLAYVLLRPRPSPALGRVVAVSRSETHTMSKVPQSSIQLIEGLGVEGDAHLGRTVKHRSRIATQGHLPNLRQVHLIHQELHDLMATKGFKLTPGAMGENVLTSGVQLLDLSQGTRLHIGSEVSLVVTGLRNPCPQLDTLSPGLMDALRPLNSKDEVQRLAGIMTTVEKGGCVRPGDVIRVERPWGKQRPLEVV
jgi:MOSC domain-containing protein YiiM